MHVEIHREAQGACRGTERNMRNIYRGRENREKQEIFAEKQRGGRDTSTETERNRRYMLKDRQEQEIKTWRETESTRRDM
jgi:hypothetical protein